MDRDNPENKSIKPSRRKVLQLGAVALASFAATIAAETIPGLVNKKLSGSPTPSVTPPL